MAKTPHVAGSAAPFAFGAVIGFLMSILGPLWPLLVAFGLLGLGRVTRRHRRVLAWLALGLAVGAVAYIVLGLAQTLIDAPASGSGAG
jgi:hypothetical protein